MMDTTEPVPQFGCRTPGLSCEERPSAYGVILDDHGRLAIALCNDELHLPGGGIEPGESGAAAVEREAREETGLEVQCAAFLGRANEYVFARKRGQDINKLSEFYLAHVVADHGDATAHGHALLWVDLHPAAGRMRHESQAWAVRRALELGA